MAGVQPVSLASNTRITRAQLDLMVRASQDTFQIHAPGSNRGRPVFGATTTFED